MRAPLPLKLSLAFVVLLAACGDSKSADDTLPPKPKITVSSVNDPTSEMLSEIYAQALERSDFRVARKQPYDTPDALFAAMEAGDVQLAAASSKALFAWVQAKTGATDPMPNTTTGQAEVIVKGLPDTMKVGVPSTAEDKDIVFCSKTFTDANTIATLTDLGTKPGIATLAAPDGFDTATPMGAGTLKDTYSIAFKAVVPTTADKTLDAVTAGTADCGVGRSADPALTATTITVLEDDKALVPNDVVLPVLAGSGAGDDVKAVADQISASLTTEQLRALIKRIKVEGASPELVASEFNPTPGP